jgi:hypothetical protein
VVNLAIPDRAARRLPNRAAHALRPPAAPLKRGGIFNRSCYILFFIYKSSDYVVHGHWLAVAPRR